MFGDVRKGSKKAIVSLLLASLCFAGNPLDALAEGAVNRPIRDKWALVIGISEFANPKINLQYPAKDAQDFAQYLVKEAGFAPDHVKLLINKDATEKRILSELGNKWLPRVANPDDLVVLFISTHGSGAELDVGGQNYLLAYDTDVDDLYTSGIPMQKLARDIRERIHCDRVVIFLDACHSGATTTGGAKGLFRSGVDAGEMAAGSGQLVITSSKEDQISWESKSQMNSVFTATLLEALRSKGGQATIGQIYDNLKDRVQNTVLRERGVLQTPVMKSEWQGNDLVLARKPENPQPGLDETKVFDVSPNDGSTQSNTTASSTTSPTSNSSGTSSTSNSTTSGAAPKIASSNISTTASDAAPVILPPKQPSSIVPGRRVGRTKLGMTGDEILKMLGKPTDSSPDVLIYRSQDRRNFLALHLKNNILEDVAFSSPAFCTEDGINVKSFPNDTPAPNVAAKFDKRYPLSNGTVLYEIHGGGLLFITGPGNEVGVVTNISGSDFNTSWVPGQQSSNVPIKKADKPSTYPSVAPVTPHTILPGKGLNKAVLGMSKDAVLTIYGRSLFHTENTITYHSPKNNTFLCLQFRDDKLAGIAFNSHVFATVDGVSLDTFDDPAVRKKFSPPVKSADGKYQIYRLNTGGFSVAVSPTKTIGWIHASSDKAEQTFWP